MTSNFYYFFFIVREIDACLHLMASLSTCLEHLQTLLTWSNPGELFPRDDADSSEELLKKAENINLYPFYGRCLGFQVHLFIYLFSTAKC